VYHANKASLPQHAKDLLPKLRKITVIGVESITTTLSLGTCHEPTPEDVSFEETDDKYTVFFSRSSTSTSIDLHICGQLSRLLEINMTALFFCVNSNSAVVNGLFEFQGIEQIPDDSDDGDGSWLQAMLHPNEPVVPPAPVPVPAFVPVPTTATEQRPLTPPLPTPSPSLSSVSVHDTRQFPPLGTRGPRTPRQRTQTSQTPFHSPLNGHAHGVNGRQRHRSEVGVAEHSQFLTPPLAHPGMTMGNTRDMGRLAAQAQAFLNGNVGQSLMVPGTTGNPVWPPFGNFGVPPPMTGTEDTDLVGVMGEHYVRCGPVLKRDDADDARRCLRSSGGCSMTSGPTTGRANCETTYQASRTSAVTHTQISRTTIPVDNSHASGSALRRLHCGTTVGRGIILRLSRRVEWMRSRFI
jgi:hypothetical protein